MRTLITTISTLVILAGSLLGLTQAGLLSQRDAVALFIISLVLCVCLGVLFKEELKPIKDTIRNIEDFLVRLCSTIASGGELEKVETYKPLYEKGSRLEITREGMEILERIGFKADIDDNLPKLLTLLEERNPKTPFDVEQLSIGLIRYLMMTRKVDIFNRTENFLYNHPEYNHPEYFKTAGLYLRNKYLDKHPELLENERS